MKTKAAWLGIAVLLLVGSLAAAETPAAADLAATLAPAAMSPLTGSCANSLAEVSLPGTTPPSVPLTIHCGTCSASPCSGAAIGQACEIGLNTRGTCQNVYGNTCGGAPISWMCQCWNGPLP
jgi:hypothetical protein